MRGGKPKLKQSPGPMTAAPSAPCWMQETAKQEWERVAPILAERKILTDADLGSLESYCVAYGQVRDCQKTLADLPSYFFESENGAPRPHPALRVMHTAMTIQRQLAAELGLTPVSRSRPAINDDGPEEGGFGDLVG